LKKAIPASHQKKTFLPKQPPQDRKPHFQRSERIKKEELPEVVCYGCGTPGVIKPKCPSYKEQGKSKKDHGKFSSVVLQSACSPSKQLATLEVTINGVMGTACADTAATHSIAGERLHYILKEQGTTFATSSLMMSLADGSQIEREVHTTCVKIRLGGRTLPLNLVAIPGATENNTLLGIDFLSSAGIVLNLKRKTWLFSDQPRRQFHFIRKFPEPSDVVDSNVSPTTAQLTVKEADHPDHLYEDEVQNLTSKQQSEKNDHPDHLYEDRITLAVSIQPSKLDDRPDQLREDEGTHLMPFRKRN